MNSHEEHIDILDYGALECSDSRERSIVCKNASGVQAIEPSPPFPRASHWSHHSLNNSKHPCFCLIFICYGETHRGNDKLACVVF